MPRCGTILDENVPPCTRGDFTGVTNRPPPTTPYAPAARRGAVFIGVGHAALQHHEATKIIPFRWRRARVG